MEEKVNYYAVIPSNVRYSNVSANAKLLYGEITALANKEGYCWASDSYFGEMYGVSRETANRWVKELKNAKFINVETIKDPNGTLRKIFITPVLQKAHSPVLQKHHTNNTSINNTNNNILVETQRVYDLYIKTFNKNPNLYKLTINRKRKIRNRLKDCGFEMLKKAIESAGAHPFYTGSNDRGWQADLDYITRSYEIVERLNNLESTSKIIEWSIYDEK